MKWIGLTGGMGCGKSTALKEFKKLGCGVLSADELVHNLYKDPVFIDDVCELLKISKEDFSRKTVAKTVFEDSDELKKLEGLIHPKLKDTVKTLKKKFEDQNLKASFYEVPLLFENSLQNQFDFTVCVGASEGVQFKRIKARNNWTDEEIKNRLSHQMSVLEKKNLADFYIDNSGTLDELKGLCESVLEKILI